MPAVGNPPSNAIVTIADGASLASAGCRFGSSLRGPRGFTLIELLVALSLVAVIAVLSWRGIDAMARAQKSTQQDTDEVLALQAGLEAIHVPEASAPQVALDAGFVDGASPSSDRFSEPASAITHRLFKFPHPLQPISA